MAGFDDEDGELFSEGEEFHESEVGLGFPAMCMREAAAQHAHNFLEAVDEMMWDPEELPPAEGHVGMDIAPGMPELPLHDCAEPSSDSTSASSSGSNFDSPARLLVNMSVDESPQSVFSVGSPAAAPVSSSASSSSAAGSRRVRIKGKTAGVSYKKTDDEAQMHAKMARLIANSAFQLYRKCPGKERRMVNKRFVMAKSRFMNRLSKFGFVELSVGSIIRLNPNVPTKLQMRGLVQKWLDHGSHNLDLKPLDRGCFINNLLLSMPVKTVSPLAGYTSLSGLSVLLTWHGEWGTCALDSLPVPANAGCEEVLEKLLGRPWVQSLWAEFRKQVEVWADGYSLPEWAISAEMCTRTFAFQRIVRVHLHAWVMLPPKRATGVSLTLNDFKFMESLPHNSNHKLQNKRGSGQAFAGSFYVNAPKIGGLFSVGTKEMFTDYPVSPAWITTLLAAGKLDWEPALDLYVRCAQNVEYNLKSVQAMRQYYKQQEMYNLRLRVEKSIRQKQSPFKRLEAVEEWDREYDEVKDRYKFLVLDGRSRTGKSRFAASRTLPEKFLNIDCSSATEPDLRHFDRAKHNVVLWDEASPQLVLRVKKLAQASVDEVRLGQSATNVNSYVVWFHRIKLIVASNKWASEMRTLAAEDQEWLTMNSVYVWVDAPLHE